MLATCFFNTLFLCSFVSSPELLHNHCVTIWVQVCQSHTRTSSVPSVTKLNHSISFSLFLSHSNWVREIDKSAHSTSLVWYLNHQHHQVLSWCSSLCMVCLVSWFDIEISQNGLVSSVRVTGLLRIQDDGKSSFGPARTESLLTKLLVCIRIRTWSRFSCHKWMDARALARLILLDHRIPSFHLFRTDLHVYTTRTV